MATPKKTKDLARRIDPSYHRRLHPFRRLRLLLCAGLCAAAGVWVLSAFALGHESIYVRGGVAAAHARIEERCDRCHVDRFGAVPDSACADCHAAGPHVPEGREPRDPACGTCHAEHGGRDRVAAVADAHCNACHTQHRSVTSIDDHVQFARVAREEHLRFSHRDHLAPALLGGPLGCADCHGPEAGGRDFQPIRFEEHCARCHRDRLDPEAPLEVPHGIEAPRLSEWALAILLRQALEEGRPPAAAGPGSAVPGRAVGPPPEWMEAVRAQAEAATGALLTPGRGCLLCHEGERDRIVPPEIPSNWLPKATFDHRTHRVEKCETCHRAVNNTQAATLDVPGVETCRKCHGEGGVSGACVTCHPYHPPDPSAWR